MIRPVRSQSTPTREISIRLVTKDIVDVISLTLRSPTRALDDPLGWSEWLRDKAGAGPEPRLFQVFVGLLLNDYGSHK